MRERGNEKKGNTMSTAIQIDDEFYSAAQQIAKAEDRTVASQITFWARLGKAALDNPDLPIEFILETLISKNQDRALAEPFVPASKHD